MSWTISGTYVAGCSCAVLCSCPYDGQPRDAKGGTECLGTAVFHVADGNLGDLDLSDVDFAFYNHFPSNLSSGNWKVGLVVDSAASDEQAEALDRILSGREGGPFGQLSQFYGEYLGMERARVSLTDGDRPGLTVEGRTELSYQPLTGPDGSSTKIKNAMFGFAPEFEVGTTTGRSNAFGLSYEASYGETADYVFSSEETEEAAHGRV
ncbi:DUF1326 domain-containing protein [Streptomyces canus]|uniref:DUF1326 domain-containing protein n=1 Tax=Streptomyces canus TaxID=58343 RepID=A0AAW8FFN7_9ACTN|nr:DUF1326 domain-containing protein [Streptomyces canus]MDQ0763883.1 hypothetical protein [Streptomyces canus]MDQ0907628.1 hypothetical protein [Streptomyces canus]MDQ1067631.1 hypothetical protein [Streptomyces canus]